MVASSPPTSPTPAPPSAWRPLRTPLFRALWIATVVSHVGSYMTDVGQGWLMASLSPSPLLVALMTTAESLPYLLFGLLAGALADVVDRRRLLLLTQAAMALVSAALAVCTLSGWITPAGLLLLATALGTATALNDPAWFAIPTEILPEDDVAAGITLNGAGLNIGRAIGPALGGIIVAAAGPGFVFLLDSLSVLGVLGVLLAWRRDRKASVLPTERIAGAIRAGLRFARHSVPLRRVLLHTFAFMACAVASLALMPLLARETGAGALALGLLLGAMGAGALVGASILPRLRARLSVDGLLTAGTATFALVIFGLGQTRALVVLIPLLVAGGTAWMTVLSSLNIAAQRASPAWVKARALAVYLIVLQAGIAGGSAVWGTVAAAAGLTVAYSAAAAGLALGILALRSWRLAAESVGNQAPSHHWPDPELAGEPRLEDGPVMVQIEYRVVPARADDFARAMEEIGASRRRHGAVQWWLFRDTAEPETFVETWIVETWAEHLRQHERVSIADRDLEVRTWAFLVKPETPRARHFVPGYACPACDAATRTVETQTS